MGHCHIARDKGIREFVHFTTIIAIERDDVEDIAAYVIEEAMAYASENSIEITLEALTAITANEMIVALLEVP